MVHYLTHTLLLLATAAEDGDGGSGGNALVSLLPLILIGGLFYMLLIRPQRRRMRDMEHLRKSIDIGDEVRTVGGIFGVVTGVNGDVMMIDVGSGTTLRVATRAVAAKVNTDVPEDDDA